MTDWVWAVACLVGSVSVCRAVLSVARTVRRERQLTAECRAAESAKTAELAAQVGRASCR